MWGGARSVERTYVPHRTRPRPCSPGGRKTRRPGPTARLLVPAMPSKAKDTTRSSLRSCAARAVCVCRRSIWWMSARCAMRARTARGSRCGTSAPYARTCSASRTPCGATSPVLRRSETCRGRATGDAAHSPGGASLPRTRTWCPPRTRLRPGEPWTHGWGGSGGRCAGMPGVTRVRAGNVARTSRGRETLGTRGRQGCWRRCVCCRDASPPSPHSFSRATVS